MRHKSLIVKDDTYGASELNRALDSGWVVVHTCPMPSSVSVSGDMRTTESIRPACLVVISDEEIH